MGMKLVVGGVAALHPASDSDETGSLPVSVVGPDPRLKRGRRGLVRTRSVSGASWLRWSSELAWLKRSL